MTDNRITNMYPLNASFTATSSLNCDNTEVSTRTLQLPIADEVALQHSQQLREIIIATIRNQATPLSFADYMQLALYYPGFGYYASGNQKLGASGDFITAPELSPLFSKCLARSCQSILTS